MITRVETPAAGLAAWITDHEVSWEVVPVLEQVKGRGVEQTGQALKLFARFDVAAGEIEPVARPIHERLRSLAMEAVQSLPAHLLVQVEPPGRAVVSPGTPFVVEVQLTLVASVPHPDSLLPPVEVRRLVSLLEKKLSSMGLKKRG
ncbi:MAG TPA: hypothetical protein VFM88_18935 [Vicinamibacteria bacterium]|nr:hypothetical protein [Vicinamibacteria bacterium]